MYTKTSLGKTLRDLRKKRKEPLRVVAAAIEIDSSLLSKIEHGERFPTERQLVKFAEYFGVPFDELKAQSIADRIVASYVLSKTTLQALKIAEARINQYLENQENE